MAQQTVPCSSCKTQRVPHHMLRIECLLPEHEGGHRDCPCPFHVCRPALSGKQGRGHRPDCIRNSVMGADIHAISQVSA